MGLLALLAASLPQLLTRGLVCYFAGPGHKESRGVQMRGGDHAEAEERISSKECSCFRSSDYSGACNDTVGSACESRDRCCADGDDSDDGVRSQAENIKPACSSPASDARLSQNFP